ncbi:hypothetical protein FKB34_06345 [Glycocaulis profundi]|nr:hypothetical protein FKB34_06345 [Glycocaulis profundi]
MTRLEAIALGAAATLLVTAPAHAYLDPATGAAVTSAIMGFFAAIYFTLKKYYHRIMRVFRRGTADQENIPS